MSLIGFEQPLLDFLVGMYSYAEAVLGPEMTNFFTTAMGIAVYGIILGTFYKNFSKQRFFVLAHEKGESTLDKVKHIVALILKYTFAFPLITFIWFLFLTLFLVFLSNQDPTQVMYIALAVVAATRIAAYWDEGIAEDIGKTLPIALLGYFLGDPSFLNPEMIEQKFFQVTTLLPLSLPLFIYIISLEWGLRVLLAVYEVFYPYRHYIPEPIRDKVSMENIRDKWSRAQEKKSRPEQKQKKNKRSGKKQKDIEEMGLEE
ncbi:MAG: hypothetical protein ACLFUZ_02370 [Candidatus Micrarchaeia archaeon]